MATKRYYATGGFKYQHRMLTAGDPVDMSGPDARLYLHLGKVSATKPKVATATPVASPPPAAPTKAPAKRKRKK